MINDAMGKFINSGCAIDNVGALYYTAACLMKVPSA
jgi:hypothetical protein